MHIRDATEADLPEILSIYNDAVQSTTALFTDSVVDLDDRRAWLAARASQGYPVIIATQEGEVLGYGSFGDFRAWPGYRHTVEHSLYVLRERRRRGVGAALLAELIERARALNKHAMIAGIEASNTASLELHARANFREVARLPQVGAKFGRWLDLVFMERFLDERSVPPDAPPTI